MPIIGAIDTAIEAHRNWKGQLVVALSSGQAPVPIATIRSTHDCEFGAWLYGALLTDDEKRGMDYPTVVERHAHFHNVAGRVVELVVGGNRAAAEHVLSHEYEVASNALLAAMLAWKKRIEAETKARNASP